MTAVLVAAFLLLHALLHPGVWTAPQQPAGTPAAFVPGHSWALSAARVPPATAGSVALAIAWYTAVVYGIAGAGVLAETGWWPTAALVGASMGLLLKVIWFHPWLTVGALLDIGVIIAVVCAWPASLY
ncbi:MULTISPECIES: hypothetical protein [unclassified Streptomyces]|uniref:hypothetical protein n=1 Tax=unclassified Streptomyces TaxID=2593676 RepID=UPI0013BD7C82|nr:MULTISPECIES: hypothetical protein [unclassified Streptomyces]MCX4913188.1 hypothetical protein [Streptomyces sp. NBC_00687]NEB33813.1 hypothetical protein [Streptomyces sp. SID14446]WSK64711.1 hypothetical protein OG458_35120 [Streptomyces sp. NBC_01281]